MNPRLHVTPALAAGAEFDLPEAAARHVQVLRLQPGAELTLFDGHGGQWRTQVLHMGKRTVSVRVLEHEALERELPMAVTLALGVPANDRMDTLVEKATELGATAIQPLLMERSVLRLADERAARKVAHWQAVAVAACEQCGRNRVPALQPMRTLHEWLQLNPTPAPAQRLVLSLGPDTLPLAHAVAQPAAQPVTLLSGPEGGLSPVEEATVRDHGFQPVTLGNRVLRADTAPLAALSWLGVAAIAAAGLALL
ncbi:16S rRNA (uracil(1498)-N(3))-methyltransferase [Azohydromonas aeria]|uniref:16S rRNA (uracil(1498)-N(3))-methyltransferase n=1 Tax=Azohydromonas aeria TaxID=2590212 RepID=UPI0012F82ED9|nr:16S rRNA (uracil(1498)-N(3))-methyltransferase [Azohydromonas aeria]